MFNDPSQKPLSPEMLPPLLYKVNVGYCVVLSDISESSYVAGVVILVHVVISATDE